MSQQNLDEKGFVSIKFVIFLKATIAKMVATKALSSDFIGLNFWQTWPKKVYHTKSYECNNHDCDDDDDDMEMESSPADPTTTAPAVADASLNISVKNL